MTKKRWFAVVIVVGIVAGAAVTMAAMSGGSNHKADDSPLVMPATTLAPPSTVAPTTTTPATLPQPDAPPSDPYAPTPLVQVGVVEIPKIGLAHPVFEGITLTVIDHGPGHWPGSAMPCQMGNSVFPGHRVTHSHPFLNLDQVSPGDHIIFHMPGHDCVYEATGTQIVKPTDMWVTDPTPTPTITLIACHPKHSAAQRIVVKGKLIGDIPAPGSNPTGG